MSHVSLRSERVVIAAPMSFSGSAQRFWKLTPYPAGDSWAAAARALTIVAVILLIVMAWMIILCWYAIFGLLVVPYRLLRRGQRKRRRDELQHRETLAAIERGRYHP